MVENESLKASVAQKKLKNHKMVPETVKQEQSSHVCRKKTNISMNLL